MWHHEVVNFAPGGPNGPQVAVTARRGAVRDPTGGASPRIVVGLPSSEADPGIAFPFGALTDRAGAYQVVGFEYEGEPAVLLWSDAAQGGAA